MDDVGQKRNGDSLFVRSDTLKTKPGCEIVRITKRAREWAKIREEMLVRTLPSTIIKIDKNWACIEGFVKWGGSRGFVDITEAHVVETWRRWMKLTEESRRQIFAETCWKIGTTARTLIREGTKRRYRKL